MKRFGYGKPLSVPALDEAWAWWRAVTTTADPYLDSLAGAKLTRRWKRESSGETPGTKLHRTTYHYWFHLGESQAIRQLLGPAKKLPDFVGGFGKSQYRPERQRDPDAASSSPRRWRRARSGVRPCRS